MHVTYFPYARSRINTAPARNRLGWFGITPRTQHAIYPDVRMFPPSFHGRMRVFMIAQRAQGMGGKLAWVPDVPDVPGLGEGFGGYRSSLLGGGA